VTPKTLMRRSRLLAAVVALIASAGVCIDRPAHAAPTESLILIEADTGKVLFAENAGYPWYPASITKVMTVYLALQAVREGRLRLDTLLTVSANAAAEPPSKMGFKPGTRLTLDNALKMLMVKSANDIAVVVAEGVGGSVPAFAAEMNRTAQRLGMVQSHYVNPHGLPDEGQISSARDIAILARAILRDFPEHRAYFDIPAVRLGKRMMRNYNTLIDRYPGADGMKTGFICSAGFNLVASATRDGKRLIAVALGQPSSPVRAVKAAQMLERGFSGAFTQGWLAPSLGNVESLQPIAAMPPDLREVMCGKHRQRPAAESVDADDNIGASASDGAPELSTALSLAAVRPASFKAADLIAPPGVPSRIVDVYLGDRRPATSTTVATTGNGTVTPVPAAKPGRTAARTPAGKTASKPAAATSRPAATGSKSAAAKATAKSTAAKSTAAKPAKRPDEPAWTSLSTTPLAASPPAALTATSQPALRSSTATAPSRPVARPAGPAAPKAAGQQKAGIQPAAKPAAAR